MGSGKSVTGMALAALWQVPFSDADRLVERRAGKSIPKLFAAVGEAGFRELEHQVIADLLTHGSGVVALGGGALTNPGNLDLVQAYLAAGGAVVFLDVTLPVAMSRIGHSRRRPMLASGGGGGGAGGSEARWLELAAQRRPAFEAVATCTIQTDSLQPAEVAQAINDQLAAGSDT